MRGRERLENQQTGLGARGASKRPCRQQATVPSAYKAGLPAGSSSQSQTAPAAAAAGAAAPRGHTPRNARIPVSLALH